MGKLKALPPRLPALSPRLPGAVAWQDRDRMVAWRRWYKTARWQRLRWSVLVESLFTCARCGLIEGNTSQLVADHKVAHRGDADLFWDRSNLQCLCKACHDSDKQREERAGR